MARRRKKKRGVRKMRRFKRLMDEYELDELYGEQKEHVKIVQANTVWDSGLKIARTVQIYVPFKVLSIVRSIEEKLPMDVEFSVLFKARRDGNKIYVEPEYYIPKQEVSYSTIEYQEDLGVLREQGYRVVVHKHPSGITDFSSTDDEHINAHFDASILYVGKGFQKAVVRVKLDEETILLVPAEIVMEEDEIEVQGIENIEIVRPRYLLPPNYIY